MQAGLVRLSWWMDRGLDTDIPGIDDSSFDSKLVLTISSTKYELVLTFDSNNLALDLNGWQKKHKLPPLVLLR